MRNICIILCGSLSKVNCADDFAFGQKILLEYDRMFNYKNRQVNLIKSVPNVHCPLTCFLHFCSLPLCVAEFVGALLLVHFTTNLKGMTPQDCYRKSLNHLAMPLLIVA